MFATDQTRIAAWANKSPDNFARIIQFVIITARVPLYRVPGELIDAIERPDESTALWGWKTRAFRHAWNNRNEIFHHCQDIMIDHDRDALLTYLVTLPGLGLAKGGFVAQLIFGVSGCIDTHNLTRAGLHPRAFREFKPTATAKCRRKRVLAYHAMIDTLGGTERLWNDWCAYLANNQPKTYRNAEHVSALHCNALSHCGLNN
jgi:hypothetical protein